MFDLFKFSASKSRHLTKTFRLEGPENLQERLLLAGDVEFFDLEPGAFGSIPSELTDINRTLFFAAFSSGNGVELWTSDGTEAGTSQLKDIRPGGGGPGQTGGSYPNNLTQVGGVLLFAANNGGSGDELWASDGSSEGTFLLKDINGGGGGSNISEITGLGPLGGRAVFSANDGNSPGNTGQELWISDTTNGGTRLLKNVNPNVNPQGTNDNIPDGRPYSSFPQELTAVGGNVFFTADSGTSKFGGANDEVWFTDGTTGGTFLVKEVNAGGTARPDNLINHNGLLYYVANDGLNGRQIWRTNGTSQGTIRVTNINTGGGGGNPTNLKSVGNEVWFSANDGTNGQEIWRTSLAIESSEADGAINIKDVNPGLPDSDPSQFTQIGDTVFFSAYNAVTGLELWKSDGTDAGTVLLKDINAEPTTPVARGSDPENLTDLNGTLFFSAYTIENGVELWSSDGTTEGTTIFTDINRRTSSGAAVGSYPSYYTVIDGILYFRANDGVTGNEFYKLGPIINGTEADNDIVVFVDDINGVRIGVDGLIYQFGFQNGIVVDAKGGYDNVIFTGGAGDETVIMENGMLSINGGNYEVIVTNVEEISTTGGEGNDTAIFRDTPGNDRFIGRPGMSTLNSAGFRLTAGDFEQIRINGTTGNDIAFLYDSAGDDRFYVYEDRGIIAGTGFDIRTSNFDSHYGFASSGNDMAFLYDNSRNNQYSAFSTHVQITGGGMFSRATGFDESIGYSTGGVDRAVLFDTAGKDTFYGRPTTVEMRASNGARYRAENFARNDARSTGGDDVAVFYDSASRDVFYGNPDDARLVGPGYNNNAYGFSRVIAVSSSADDVAVLTDSAGDDRFYGRATSSQLFGSGFLNQANNFSRVIATASRGNDFAYLFDSSGDDRFYGEKLESRMIGTGFANIARRFDKTFARASDGSDFAYLRDTNGNEVFTGRPEFALMTGSGLFYKTFGFDKNFAFATGGNDQANLYDGPGDDVFYGRGRDGRLSGDGFFYKALGFNRIRAYATAGGVDTINNDALSFRFERYGQWENIV